MSRNVGRYRSSKEVLEAVFAIPSDAESEDDKECSDEEVTTADDLQISEHEGVPDAEQSSEEESDDDILYRLATSYSDCSVRLTQEVTVSRNWPNVCGKRKDSINQT